ncbi:MAG: FMN-binding protein [bacterium]|nr:FMN-binding protein [bacterium]
MTTRGNPTWKMVALLVGLTTLCGLLLLLAHAWSAPIIQQKQEAALRSALVRVLPQAKTFATWTEQGGQLVPPLATGKDLRLFEGLDNQGQRVGWVIEAQGAGYQEPIRLLFGLDVQGQQLNGFEVLDSKETPGLGDRIEKDPSFLANFKALDLSQPIRLVKPGHKTKPSQIEGITGATVSSQAVAHIIQRALASRLPLVKQ